MMQRDLIAMAMLNRPQPQPQPQQRQPQQPRPFMPPQVPSRVLPPTMIGTPRPVQQAAADNMFQQAMRNADPIEQYEGTGGGAFVNALKKYFTPTDQSGGAAP